MAEKEGVDLRLYEIIYRMTEDIEKALKGMLEPEITEKILGRATVLQVFEAGAQSAACHIRGRLLPVDDESRHNPLPHQINKYYQI